MSFNFSPKVTTDGLVLFLDVANIKSFDGVNWLDLSRSSNNGSLINSPTYNSSNKGSIIFKFIMKICRKNLSEHASGIGYNRIRSFERSDPSTKRLVDQRILNPTKG